MRLWRAVFILVTGLMCAGLASGLSLTADNNPISFSASAGQTFAQCGSSCTTTTDISASDGVSTLNFSAVAASSPDNWLSVTPNQATTPATLTVNANPAGLQAGNYSGTITLACDQGSSCTGLVINVTFSIEGVVLNAAPSPVNVTVTAGQSATKSVTLTGVASVSVSITSGGSFIQAPPSVNSPGTLTLTINAASLSAGPYSGSLNLQCVNGAPCLPVTVGVNVTVLPAVQLNAGPLSNSLSGYSGQTLAQCGTTCTATFTLAASTGSLSYLIVPSSSGNWLGASPLTGTVTTTATTISVTANPNALTSTSYQGTLTITCTGTSSCPQVQVTVSFTVSAPATLTGAPPTISFSAGSGQSAQCSSSNCSFVVTASSGSLNFRATANTTSGGSWLMVTPTHATTPASLTVTASAASLQVGNYSGTITLACDNGSTCTPVTIIVSINVSGVDLIAAPNIVPVIVVAGQTTTTSVTLSTMNTGIAAVNVSVASGSSFLQAPTSVSAPTSLTLTIIATNLVAGRQTGLVQLTCTASPCITVTLTVNVTVVPAPVLNAGALSNALSATAGQTQAQCGAGCTAMFTLSASSGSLNFQISASSIGNWLGASLSIGTATTSGMAIMVTANPAGLAPNTYIGTLLISCMAPSTCTSIQVGVSFTVNQATPTLSTTPSSLSFTAIAGRGNPPAKTVTVSSSDGSPQSFTVSGVPAWLGVSPLAGTTGQASGTLTLTPNAAAAPQSGAVGTVTITPSNGSSISLAVSITFSPFSISATPSTLTIGLQAGATQTQTIAIGTVDGGSATVTLAVSGSTAVSVGAQQLTVPASVNVIANAAGLQAGSSPSATVTISCTSANPCTAVTVPVQVIVTAGTAPTINQNGVVPIFSTVTTVQQGEWISIYGTNLGTGTFYWNGNFPQSLGGTSVTIDGRPAYMYFVEPTQVNVQVPNDSATGTVLVVVNTPTGSITSTVTLGEFGPSFSLIDSKHVAGIIYRPDGSGAYGSGSGSYDIIGPTGSSLGYRTVAATAGDVIALFGVGFGPTTPAVPAGQPFSGQAPTNNTVTMMMNNVNVPLSFSGLSEAGVYQFNLTVPAGLGTGDVPVVALVGDMQTQNNVVIALQ
jgi:uncharacterized protein (TIGR03437 family)